MKYGALLAILVPGIAVAQPSMEVPPQQPPQQMQDAPVRATFVSTNERPWDVWVDQQPACATPCSLSLMPLQYVALRTQERNPVRLDVGSSRMTRRELKLRALAISTICC